MKAGFIGAGKVGFSLGKYLAEGGITLSGYYSLNPESAKEAAAFTGSKYYEDLAGITEDSDTLFITVPDGAIGDVWENMRNLPIKDKNICHCSGSVSSAAFFNAEKRGACAYSIHPLQAVSDKYNSYKKLSYAYFAIEGSLKNLNRIKRCFEQLGNKVTTIPEDKKDLYHCAAVMVSNQMIALADIGAEMLTECGFERSDAEKALAPLIMGNADSIAQIGCIDALTGPVERGDADTVKGHLKALEALALSEKSRDKTNVSNKLNEQLEIYRLLSRRLVHVAERKHPDRDYKEIKKELEK